MSKFQCIVFFTIFANCGQLYAFDAGSHSIRDADIGKKITCPSSDFSAFIKAFSESAEVQMEFTKYPLKYVQLLDAAAEPEPTKSIQFLNKEKIKFPLLVDELELTKYGLKRGFKKVNKNNYVGTEVSSGETSLGYYIEYKFRYVKDCWKLVDIINQST